MNRRRFWMGWVTAALAIFALAAPARGQEGSGAGFKADVLADFERVSGKLVSLAEAIPAEKYGWRPSDEVRTVSQIFMHVATTNYGLPPGFGAPPAEGMPQGFEALTEKLEAISDKAEVLDTLRQSIDNAKQAVAGVADEEVGGKVQFFGQEMSRRRIILILLTHAHEHLGQAIAYARSIGVVPPWSRGGQ